MMETRIFDLKEHDSELVIQDTISELRLGSPVVFPTDTVYGLCTIPEPEPIIQLFKLKKRVKKQVPILFSDLNIIINEVIKSVPDWLKEFAELFWPGPFTLVLSARLILPGVSDDGFIGIRQPNHPEILQVISGLNGYIAATSANISGVGDGTDFDTIINEFNGKVPVIVKNDKPMQNIPSLVMKFINNEIQVLRGDPKQSIIQDFFNSCRIRIS